jgi:hypothetical protein
MEYSIQVEYLALLTMKPLKVGVSNKENNVYLVLDYGRCTNRKNIVMLRIPKLIVSTCGSLETLKHIF